MKTELEKANKLIDAFCMQHGQVHFGSNRQGPAEAAIEGNAIAHSRTILMAMKSPSFSIVVATLMLGGVPFTHAQLSTKPTEPPPDGPSTNRTGATNSASSEYRQIESGKGPSGSSTGSASDSKQQGSSGPPSQSAASKAPKGSVGHESKTSADKSDAKKSKTAADKSEGPKDKAQGGVADPKAGAGAASPSPANGSGSGSGSSTGADAKAPKKP